MLTDTLLRIPLDDIEVPRRERQRRTVDISDLSDSIKRRGVVTPIVVESMGEDGKYLLITGERRVTASRSVGLLDIPARLASSLDPIERQIIELEENLKRVDLEWKDSCAAIFKIHQLYSSLEVSWTQRKTAEQISMSEQNVGVILRVAEELSKGNALINDAPHYRAAYNILARRDSRRLDDAFNALVGGEDEVESIPSSPSSSSPERVGDRPSPIKTPIQEASPILTADFAQWAASFTGAPFTFLHCDFPYGIGLDKSDQGNTSSWGGYDDSEATYWKLCGVLADRLERLMAPSSHLMFWLSSDFTIIHNTLQFFSQRASSLDFNPKPLIWMKTDGKGILPDPKRGPRHIYETAFFASRGDRLVAQPVADAYGAPKGSSGHQSEKPEPMLRHFFRMFIDEGTSILDPTCGYGSSIRAAESLGAKRVLGLEINPSWAEDARKLLQRARSLKKAELTLEGIDL